MRYVIKREVFLGCTIFAMLSFFIFVDYDYRSKFNLKVLSPKDVKNFISPNDGVEDVKTTITSNMGSDFILKMRVSFPCDNKEQQDQLTNSTNAIISDFLMETDHKRIQDWIEQKNMSPIKSRLIKIANRYSRAPVKNVYFETLNW